MGGYFEGNQLAQLIDALSTSMVIGGSNPTLTGMTLITGDTDIVDGDKLGQIDFVAPYEASGGDAILVGASIWAEADDTFSATVNSTELVFATGTSEAAAEKVRIDRDGNVGIGTAAPQGKIHLLTNIAAATDAEMLTLQNIGGLGTGTKGIIWRNETGTNGTPVGGIGLVFDGTSTNFSFHSLYNSGFKATSDVVMTVMGTGSVGIGTTAPSSKLSINGGLHVGGDSDAGDNNLLVDGTVTIGTAPVYGMRAVAGGTFGTTSDVTPINSQVYTMTPSGSLTLNAIGTSVAGARWTCVVITSGTSSYTITFGTNLKSQGTLATGTTTAKYFTVSFICVDGTVWAETGRTTAM